MNYNFQSVENVQVKGKRIFLRLDLDVPLCKDEIEDQTRLLADFPTVKYLLKQGAKVIIGGHLGRPGGFDKLFSLEPVAEWFCDELGINKTKIKKTKLNEFDAWEISENLFLLENLRFYKGEETNDLDFSKKLAALADIYVNDAFAMCHRDHASITGISRLLPHFAGFRLQKEVLEMSNLLQNPERPLVVIIGGAKIETKLPLVLKMYGISDYVLVGGKIAQQKENLASACGRTNHKCIALMIAELNEEGTDLTEEDIQKFLGIIEKAKTIVWNGPMGLIRLECRIGNGTIEEEESEKGTRIIAQAIVKSSAYKIAGGGDTVEFLQKLKLTDKFDFISTGGGAMLAFLSGETLPGLEALEK